MKNLKKSKEIVVLCRTSNTAELDSFNSFVSKNRYFEISYLVRAFLLKNKVTALPIDLKYILKRNGWASVSYEFASKIIDNFYFDYPTDSLGFCIYYKCNYIIFYNNKVCLGTQRFTIAHEIGHIVLNHFCKQHEKLHETEANMFASRMLMPINILKECNVSSSKELEILCKVSNISAEYRFKRLKMLNERNRFYIDKNELILTQKFSNFIKNYINKKY